MKENTIYYCKFGSKKLTNKENKILNNWQEKGYQIFEINENNFPIEQYLFAKTAYQAKKYAFVADVARIHYLHENGGIYLDTDVEIVKRIDEFIKINKLVISFEYFEWELTGLNMGTIIANKQNSYLTKLLEYYQKNSFQMAKINDLTINNLFLKIVYNNELIINNQQFEDNQSLILPYQYFCTKSKSSYTIHHYAQSWKESKSKPFIIRRYIGKKIKKIIGPERFKKIWKKH